MEGSTCTMCIWVTHQIPFLDSCQLHNELTCLLMKMVHFVRTPSFKEEQRHLQPADMFGFICYIFSGTITVTDGSMYNFKRTLNFLILILLFWTINCYADCEGLYLMGA